MRNAGRIVSIVLLGAVVPLEISAGAQPESAADDEARALRQKVAQLAADLDADSRETRTAAQRELLRLGPAALPHLPSPELLPNSAVRATVRRLRLALEEQHARESVQPSRISLSGEVTLGDAVRRLADQSGNAIDASGLPPELLQRPVRVGFRETAFWDALDALARQAGMAWSIAAGSDAIRLEPLADESERGELAVDGSGVYRVAVTSAGLRPIAGRPAERLLRLTVRFTAEPRLRPLFFAFAGSDLKASSGGRTFEPFSPDAKKEIPFGEGGKDVRVTWDFRVPADADGAAAAALVAKATILTAAGREPITFTDLASASGVARRRGGVTVTLNEALFRGPQERRAVRPQADAAPAAETDGHTARLRVAVAYDTGGPAFESHRTWIFHNQAWLETRDGRRTAYDGFTAELQRDGAVAVEYQFDHLAGPAADYKFVYVAPTLLISVPVEIKLPEIPLSSSPVTGSRPR
ncbi:MAG TPA: hypothetical protein VML55_08050 [Planctomycetaceae bacterium]|nr:hypothetical protein [Planctomycetaceae bacterium]